MRLAKRDPAEKALAHMLAYSAGPAKVAIIETKPLHILNNEANRLVMEGMASLLTKRCMATLEAALQTRADEEGCGAVMAAANPDYA